MAWNTLFLTFVCLAKCVNLTRFQTIFSYFLLLCLSMFSLAKQFLLKVLAKCFAKKKKDASCNFISRNSLRFSRTFFPCVLGACLIQVGKQHRDKVCLDFTEIVAVMAHFFLYLWLLSFWVSQGLLSFPLLHLLSCLLPTIFFFRGFKRIPQFISSILLGQLILLIHDPK